MPKCVYLGYWGAFHPVGLKHSVISACFWSSGLCMSLGIACFCSFLCGQSTVEKCYIFLSLIHILSSFHVFTSKQRKELTTPIWHEAQFLLSTKPHTLVGKLYSVIIQSMASVRTVFVEFPAETHIAYVYSKSFPLLVLQYREGKKLDEFGIFFP